MRPVRAPGQRPSPPPLRPPRARPLWLGLAAILAGCSPDPPVVIEDEDGDRFCGFGEVALGLHGERTLTVRNAGEKAVELAAIDAESAGITEPYTLKSTTCAAPAELAAGASCTLTLQFAPLREQTYAIDLRVAYRAGGEAHTASIRVQGEGRLDCSVGALLAQAWSEGADAAAARNAEEADAGRAAGEALTEADGVALGYDEAYPQGYDDAWDGGSEAGYADGWSAGYASGAGDPAVCAEGAAAGDADGRAQGAAEGYEAGWSDGHDAAYEPGYQQGYPPGYEAGVLSCYAKAAYDPLTDPDNVEACRSRGYEATYDPDSYARAYDAAAAANPDFQRGYQAGWQQGFADGATAGYGDGYQAGAAQGAADGWQAGADEAYAGCYEQAWHPAYSWAYDDAYGPGWDDGADAGAAEGYDDGYAAGWQDGRAATCPEYG